jgi:hypothetical protein
MHTAETEDKACPFMAEHFIWRHALDTKSDADIGDFDFIYRISCDLVRDDRMPVSERMGHQVIISDLKKRAYGSRRIVLT